MKYPMFIMLFLVGFFNVFGDDPRYSSSFKSQNEQYILSVENFLRNNRQLEKWTLRNINNNVIYDFQYHLSDCTVFISNDGRNIIAIDDFSFGFISNNEIVLTFFRDGILIREYTLGDLLDDIGNTTLSASHFKWTFRDTFILENNYFRFMTFELYEYVIDSNTGNIVERKRNSILSNGSIYAYGVVTHSNGNIYNFQIMRLVYGQPEQRVIIFRNDLNIHFRNGQYMSLIIKNNVLVYRNDVLFNHSFNYRNLKE